jgi:ClpP class serine protease
VLARLIEAHRAQNDAAAIVAWSDAHEARDAEAAARDGKPRNLTFAGSTAEIRVEGVLTKRADFWAWLLGMGNTTYTSIREALAIAENERSVKSIVLGVDSPGGNVDGLFETLDAIAAHRASSSKPLRVRAENAQSAAYGIAAAAGPIEAVSRAASFGSIGTAVSFLVDPDVVTLTNTDSPDKRPDVTTPEGKAVVVKYLDQINAEFVRAIARGREVAPKRVTETFGRGASFTAPGALELGMIDKISTPPRAVSNSKGKRMANEDQNDGRASAAELDAAVQRGIAEERGRVLAHVTLGEASDMSIALEAIRSGSALTPELSARYEVARWNRGDRTRRQGESTDAARAVGGEGPATTANDVYDRAVDLVEGKDRQFVQP